MPKLNTVLSQVLQKVKPSAQEIADLEETAKDFISELGKKKIKAYVGGSLAKGTITKTEGKQDIDIFVVFKSKEDLSKLESKLKKIKFRGKPKIVHGSRDYFQIETGNAVLEIVPVMKNKDPGMAENVTDVSLSHVRYVRGIVKKNPRIVDEILLAKAFCRANNVYGAESYINGFSGYSLEVLVSYFGGFAKFLKGIQKNKIIDPAKHFKNKNEILKELNASKLHSPIILVDPTYKLRNATAGLGSKAFEKFVKVAKAFLKSPLPNYFEKHKVNKDDLKKLADRNKAKLIELNLRTDKQEGDIAGTKMKKYVNFLFRELERNQQDVIAEEFDYEGQGKTARAYLIVKENPVIEIKGPSIGLQDAAKKFRKGKKTFKRKGHWWAKKKISVKEILSNSKKISKEMGVEI